MTIVIFSGGKPKVGKRLLERIITEENGFTIEVHHTVEALSDRFHMPVMDRAIALFAPADRLQLQRLVSMGHLFNDTRVILVLPDRDPETISLGHKLYPRFVTYADNDFSCLSEVVGRLIMNETGEDPKRTREEVKRGVREKAAHRHLSGHIIKVKYTKGGAGCSRT